MSRRLQLSVTCVFTGTVTQSGERDRCEVKDRNDSAEVEGSGGAGETCIYVCMKWSWGRDRVFNMSTLKLARNH